jgi:hypothetical protein
MLSISDLHQDRELSAAAMGSVAGGSFDPFLNLGSIKVEIYDHLSDEKSSSDSWSIALASADSGT